MERIDHWQCHGVRLDLHGAWSDVYSPRAKDQKAFRKEMHLSCILCGVNQYAEIGKRTGIYLGTKAEFTIVRCSQCGLVYAIPRPDESGLIEAYRNMSNSTGKSSPAKNLIRRLKYRHMASRIKGYLPPGKQVRLLEFGCSQGHLLDAVKGDKQIVATGIDLSGAELEYAKKKELNVLSGTLQSLKLPDESFDAIVAIHVIEHLYSPVDTLAEMNRILSPGGILFSIVPCVAHIKARLAGIKWKYYTPPAHLWFFSPKTFSLLLQKTGFTSIFSSCFYNRAHLRSVAKKAPKVALS
jgi:ubiquinone/menaquinone biosynthesis C-methylase UbiE